MSPRMGLEAEQPTKCFETLRVHTRYQNVAYRLVKETSSNEKVMQKMIKTNEMKPDQIS